MGLCDEVAGLDKLKDESCQYQVARNQAVLIYLMDKKWKFPDIGFDGNFP
jgi:hypothetical protein